jgi:hypothetical protein
MNSDHGQCDVSVDENIVYIKSIGAFNLEGILKANQDIMSAVSSLGEQSFKLLVDFSELEGATPEAFEKLNELDVWLSKQSMTAKAVIINSSMTLSILGKRVPARNSHNDKNFEGRAEAIEWLKLQP